MPQNFKSKSIRVTCQGAGLARLEDLNPLQGDLKTLSEENFQKCKNALTGKHGFSFPFFVWKHKGKLWVLDGHQRDKTLKRLKEDGWKVPLLPIDYIEAGNEKEAKEKILLLQSRYGEMTDESLEEFIWEAEIDLSDLQPAIALPDIDIEDLLKEIEEDAGEKTVHEVIVSCKTKKEQRGLMARLTRQGLKCRGRSA